MAIGFSLNPVDWVESAWDVVDDIPGFSQLGDGVKSLVTGPLRDVANTVVGKVVLRALAGTVYAFGAGLLGAAGPQLASVAFAIPGLARGEDFWSAWFEESLYRAKSAAEILGPGVANDAMKTPEVKQVLDEVAKYSGQFLGQKIELFQLTTSEVAKRLGVPSLSVASVAARFGISEYAAAKALNVLLPDDFPIDGNDYDLSGKRKKGLTLVFRPPPTFAQRAAMSSGLTTALRTTLVEAQVKKDAEAAEAAEAAAAAALDSATESQTRANVAIVGVATAGALAVAWWYFNRR